MEEKIMKTKTKKLTQSLIFGTMVISLITFSLFPAGAIKAEEPTSVQKNTALNKPGVVFISTYYTVDVVIQSAGAQSSGIPELAGMTYEVEMGGVGSGFTISSDGYILTNGHVVNFEEDYLAWQALSTASYYIIEDLTSYVFYAYYGYYPTQDELDYLMPEVLAEWGSEEALTSDLYTSYKLGEIAIDNVERKVYVQQGAFVSGMKIPVDKGLTADVKQVDFEGFNEDGEVVGKDIAIIKVAAENIPTVKIGDSSQVNVGDEVVVIGYPGVATFQQFLDEESYLEPSVTRGIVSAEKTLTDGTGIIQTDAILTYGNSGGPAFNSDGEVIGIASMVATEKGEQVIGFSYLRPSNIAKEFLNEKNVQNAQGIVDEHWSKGLDYYWNDHYTPAIEEFEAAKRLYPQLVDAEDYITQSQAAISRGEEVPLTKGFLGLSWGVWVGIIIGVVILGIILVVVIIIVIVKKKGKKKQQTPPPAAPPTAPTAKK